MKKKLLVISADAMVCEDLAELKKLPNYQKYLEHGCEVTGGMKTIYPSVTYPAHISMITGCYAGTHGLTSNFRFTTDNKDQNWLGLAKDAGCRICLKLRRKRAIQRELFLGQELPEIKI